ncbi:Cell division protein FtsB [Tepidimonas thermarum]|uniref:Cell division protein FtsB n=1 Tax=Tepidimonas thermarum TaxID=335431 RepID=A0A554X605_9BURK|nr:cell division protein FtsB [Tepidimonas thermarum]TSE31268.1 Cell division protein FtsB [Tepidimonas thermarum]
MGGRWVTAVLLVLLAVVHAQLWWGWGNVSQVEALRRELAAQEQANEAARLRNERLAAEVRDLREGVETVEEIARQELGMVKPNEIFVQIQSPATAASPAVRSAGEQPSR